MKHLIFAYGSLVNKESRKKTASSWKEFVTEFIWYKRWWYFKTEKSKTTSVWIIKFENNYVNWVLFEVYDKWLEFFDNREYWYDRIELQKEEFITENFSIVNKKIWTYIVNDIELPNKNYPIVQSYVDIIMKGYLKISKKFAKYFLETTDWWENHWINNRENPVFKI